jgi:peptide/nickel transport system substrate-binding protein
MYDRLITQTPDGKYHPYLATSWEVLPSGFRFTLRTDAKCADGTPVTSEVVANSFKRFFANSYYSSEFGPGPNTVTADDATHLTITLAQPNSSVVYDFARPPTSIVCPAGLDPNADFNTESFGSGPFTLAQATHGDRAVVKARGGDWTWGPYNWKSSDAGFPDTIEFRVIENPTTAANLLATNGVDVSQTYGSDIARLSGMGLTHKVASSFLADVLAFGEGPGQVTTDEAVRRAVASAIDRSAFIQAYAAGYADPADSTLSHDAECYDPETAKMMPTYDLDKARSMLTADGWVAGPDGKLSKDGSPLALRVVGNTSQNSGPDYLLDQLQKLGAQVTLSKGDMTTYGADVRANNGEVFIRSFISGWPSHNTNISQLSGAPNSNGTTNPQLIRDNTLENAVNAARTSVGDESCRQWTAVQRTFVGHMYVLPVAIAQIHWFSQKNVDFEPVASIGFIDALTLRKHQDQSTADAPPL